MRRRGSTPLHLVRPSSPTQSPSMRVQEAQNTHSNVNDTTITGIDQQEIFQLVNLLSVQHTSDEQSAQRNNKRKQVQGVNLNVVACIELKDTNCTLVAAFCSNGNLILRQGRSISPSFDLDDAKESKSEQRKEGEDMGIGAPLLRIVRWFDHPLKQMSAMIFSPDGKSLFCLTNDATGYLLPVASIMQCSVSLGIESLLGGKRRNSLSGSTQSGKPGFVTLTQLANSLSTANAAVAAGSVAVSALSTAAAAVVGAGSNLASSLGVKISESKTHDDDRNKDVTEDGVIEGQFLVNEVDRVKELKTTSKPEETTISDCIWWRTFEGDDFAVMSTLSGRVVFVNLRDNVRCSCKLKVAIRKLELIRRLQERTTQVLIHTLDGGYYILLLEEPVRAEDSRSQASSSNVPMFSFPKHHSKKRFRPEPITRFSQESKLSVQSIKQGPAIGVYTPSERTFELYDCSLQGYPLFVYFLNPAKMYHFTSRFTFVIGPEENSSRILILSNLLAVSCDAQGSPDKALLQSIDLPADNPVIGVHRLNTDIEHDYSSLLFWTPQALFELKRTNVALNVFTDLVQGNDNGARLEILGKTLGLNLYALYEIAADQAFNQGEYQRALHLYQLSNARVSKLVAKFLRCGNEGINVAIELLKGSLAYLCSSSTEIFLQEKNQQLISSYSSLLAKSFAERLIRSRDDHFSDIEFYLQNSKGLFDAKAMIDELLRIGEVALALSVGSECSQLGHFLSKSCETATFGHDMSAVLKEDPTLTYKNENGHQLFQMLDVKSKCSVLLKAMDFCDEKAFATFLNKCTLDILIQIDELSSEDAVSLAHKLDPRTHSNRNARLLWRLFFHCYIQVLVGRSDQTRFFENDLEFLLQEHFEYYNADFLCRRCTAAELYGCAAAILEKWSFKANSTNHWFEAAMLRLKSSKSPQDHFRVLETHVILHLNLTAQEEERLIVLRELCDTFIGDLEKLEEKLLQHIDLIAGALGAYVFSLYEPKNEYSSETKHHANPKVQFSSAFCDRILRTYLENSEAKVEKIREEISRFEIDLKKMT